MQAHALERGTSQVLYVKHLLSYGTFLTDTGHSHQVTYPALAIKFLLYHRTFLLILTMTCKSAPCGGLLRLVGIFGT